MKSDLTISELIVEAGRFAASLDRRRVSELYGVTDGKAIGTHIEREFGTRLDRRYS